MKTLPPRFLGLVASKRPRDHGFTFIEVMAALVIFAFSGLVLALAYVNLLSAHQAALQRDAQAADRRLVREALRNEPGLENVTAWNDLELPDGRFARWRATVAPTSLADLFDVTLEIELTVGDGRPATHLETCRLLRPSWSQPDERETLRAEARSRLAQRTFQ